jgi:hypothetical protein
MGKSTVTGEEPASSPGFLFVYQKGSEDIKQVPGRCCNPYKLVFRSIFLKPYPQSYLSTIPLFLVPR